jgi:hypothetical protein
LLSGIIGLTSSAYACGEEDNTTEKLKGRQEDDFRRMDSDHDGNMSGLEFSHYADWQIPKGASHAVFFDSLDKDNDKLLSFSEWEKGFPPYKFMTRGCAN